MDQESQEPVQLLEVRSGIEARWRAHGMKASVPRNRFEKRFRLTIFFSCHLIKIMAAAVKWVTSSRTVWKHLFPIQNGALSSVCCKSTHSSLPDDYKLELSLTSDGGQ